MKREDKDAATGSRMVDGGREGGKEEGRIRLKWEGDRELG